MKKLPSLGQQEMDLLKFIDGNSPITVREVAAHFEKNKGLARTTVLTVMERLRKKGFLTRVKLDGVYKYKSKMEAGDVLASKVSEFIERTLGGSVSPLVSYFIASTDLSKDEISQLSELAARLETRKEVGRGN